MNQSVIVAALAVAALFFAVTCVIALIVQSARIGALHREFASYKNQAHQSIETKEAEIGELRTEISRLSSENRIFTQVIEKFHPNELAAARIIAE